MISIDEYNQHKQLEAMRKAGAQRGTRWLGEAGEQALLAGLPVGRDGEPADPAKYGLIAVDARKTP